MPKQAKSRTIEEKESLLAKYDALIESGKTPMVAYKELKIDRKQAYAWRHQVKTYGKTKPDHKVKVITYSAKKKPKTTTILKPSITQANDLMIIMGDVDRVADFYRRVRGI